jgi:hypothetical protein
MRLTASRHDSDSDSSMRRLWLRLLIGRWVLGMKCSFWNQRLVVAPQTLLRQMTGMAIFRQLSRHILSMWRHTHVRYGVPALLGCGV